MADDSDSAKAKASQQASSELLTLADDPDMPAELKSKAIAAAKKLVALAVGGALSELSEFRYARGMPLLDEGVTVLYSSDFPRGMLSVFHSLERRCLARNTICPMCCA